RRSGPLGPGPRTGRTGVSGRRRAPVVPARPGPAPGRAGPRSRTRRPAGKGGEVLPRVSGPAPPASPGPPVSGGAEGVPALGRSGRPAGSEDADRGPRAGRGGAPTHGCLPSPALLFEPPPAPRPPAGPLRGEDVPDAWAGPAPRRQAPAGGVQAFPPGAPGSGRPD